MTNEIAPAYQDIHRAKELVEKKQWSNWQTALLWICIEGLPDIRRDVIVSLTTLYLIHIEEDKINVAAELLQRWVPTEHHNVIFWKELARYYWKEITIG